MVKLVNWHDFEKKLKDKQLLLFSLFDVKRLFGVSKVATTALMHRYTRRGFIKRVKRGLHVFPDALPPDLYLANKIYEPSYVSLEFALSYHRVIPETVYEITSVTTKATRRFSALGKSFTYRTIKKAAFTGYVSKRQGHVNYLIADPEKAFVDLNYLKIMNRHKPISRFDKEKINPAKALRYAKLFNNDKLVKVIKTTLKTARR
jgi:predicted transcriptional regulator of viral defense system